MATIDLIVLGMVKQQPLSAYDIQKLVEYRNMSRWVKISTPSIYKKVIQLENKGFIKGTLVTEGSKSEKVIYALTDTGQSKFQKLMKEISQQPIHIFLDFNAVMVNLASLPLQDQKDCVANINKSIISLRKYLSENQAVKEHSSEIPKTGLAVLQQQIILAETIEKWLQNMREDLRN